MHIFITTVAMFAKWHRHTPTAISTTVHRKWFEEFLEKMTVDIVGLEVGFDGRGSGGGRRCEQGQGAG